MDTSNLGPVRPVGLDIGVWFNAGIARLACTQLPSLMAAMAYGYDDTSVDSDCPLAVHYSITLYLHP